MNIDAYKKQAAIHTIDTYVKSGMTLGLGVGSTAIHAVRYLAEKIQAGTLTDIIGIPAAQRIADEAAQLGIPLTTLDENPKIDLTFDGADEVDPQLNLIKGGGGALLREKIVAVASTRQIIMVDEGKLVSVLGESWAVPIEVTPFGLGAHIAFLKRIGGQPILRHTEADEPYLTDGQHYILDTNFGEIDDPAALAQQLIRQPGIVEHGLFIDIAAEVVVAGKDGIRTLTRS